jgi:hypothetical protein
MEGNVPPGAGRCRGWRTTLLHQALRVLPRPAVSRQHDSRCGAGAAWRSPATRRGRSSTATTSERSGPDRGGMSASNSFFVVARKRADRCLPGVSPRVKSRPLSAATSAKQTGRPSPRPKFSPPISRNARRPERVDSSDPNSGLAVASASRRQVLRRRGLRLRCACRRAASSTSPHS